jgi:hypothetical protein
MIPAVAAALLFALPASAEIFTGQNGLIFSLARGTVSSPDDADLEVTSRTVSAKHGIKRSSRSGNFQKQEVAVLGEAYDLKDAAGGKWRMWLRTVVGQVVEVELVRVAPAPKTDRAYRAVAVSIDGLQAEPTFSPLTLLADGSYRFGTVRGRYVTDEGGVTLDGVPGQWGRAAYTINGDGLIFRFVRGHAVYIVKYERLVNVASR